MNLEELHIQLLERLFKPIIFYIPVNSITNELNGTGELSWLNEWNQEILVIEKDGSLVNYNSKPDLLAVGAKKAQLDKNMFLLLKQKKILESYEFDYLIGKYQEELNLLFFLTEWLNKNLKGNLTNVVPTVESLFALQTLAFKSHYDEFNRNLGTTFLPKPEPQEIIKKVEFIIPSQSTFQKAGRIELPNWNPPNQKMPKVKRKRKPKLVSDEEAEKFLLETVFNVKLEE